jgi:hypothetical protein
MFTLKTPTLAMLALLLAAAPWAAQAERQPNKNGSCPSGYTKSADSHGKAQCYSPRDTAQKSKPAAAKGKKSSGKH